jgi:hypothetical protein
MSKRGRGAQAGRSAWRANPSVQQPARRESSRRPRWALVAGVAVATLAAAIVPTLVFSGHGPLLAVATGQQKVAGPRVQYPVTLPSGYQPPTGLASNGDGGVWFFAQGRVDRTARETLFHWSRGSRSLASYQVGTTDMSLAAGVDGAARVGLITSLGARRHHRQPSVRPHCW